MKTFAINLILAALAAGHEPARACEVTSAAIVFPGQGTRTAWYCKASDHEKKQALQAARQAACVPEKLHEWGKPPVSGECTDMIPYSLTKAEALMNGPTLDCRLILTSSNDAGYERKMGFRWLVTGHAGGPTRFDASAPVAFVRECPSSGCTERDYDLCAQPQGAEPVDF